MYTTKNYKTKKALKDDVAKGVPVHYFEPGIGQGKEPKDGRICCEGPHYPEAHKWYAECECKDGVIVKVK